MEASANLVTNGLEEKKAKPFFGGAAHSRSCSLRPLTRFQTTRRSAREGTLFEKKGRYRGANVSAGL